MSYRVLVVEDEFIIAADLESIISNLGHSVVGWTDNGLGAIELAKTLLPDIVFMDIKLKGKLDGIETAFLIDGILEKGIPFIFISAHPLEHHRVTQSLGKNIWIHKPYTSTEIEKAIEQSH